MDPAIKILMIFIVNPGLYPSSVLLVCSSLQDQLDSLVDLILQSRKWLDLLTAKRDDSTPSRMKNAVLM